MSLYFFIVVSNNGSLFLIPTFSKSSGLSDSMLTINAWICHHGIPTALSADWWLSELGLK
jgi:hypothetical protein